ncbi:MAG: hypothetical protein JWO31_597 [Phycisphaerales bacterium]|nr:hypothetical protein [Phycisphaerales bacterium]
MKVARVPDLVAEVERFRSWAATPRAAEGGAEWDALYEDWDRVYAAVLGLVDAKPFAAWSAAEAAAVLYAVARDNDLQHLAGEIRARAPGLLPDLAEAALRGGERDARWQLAEELGRLATACPRRGPLLERLAGDEDEYVRRRALGALARAGSPATERVALEAWHRPDASQEWARMTALWALHRVGSGQLGRLLDEAERDARPYLAAYAADVRRGRVDE